MFTIKLTFTYIEKSKHAAGAVYSNVETELTHCAGWLARWPRWCALYNITKRLKAQPSDVLWWRRPELAEKLEQDYPTLPCPQGGDESVAG
jgi:hypothetical protein